MQNMTNWPRVDTSLESAIEHVQSAWIGLGTYSAEERYETRWPIGTPQYHLQAAEEYLKAVYQELHYHISEWSES